MSFDKLVYTVEFLTPAFLGNAEQQAQWRTPPFKALLREWWRISQAKNCDYDYRKLLQDEKKLFGHAAGDKNDVSGQSRVRLRLSKWDDGKSQNLQAALKSFTVSDGKFSTNVGVYLGYGPIERSKTAIAVGDTASLTISCDSSSEHLIKQIGFTAQLAHWFGTLGSRSRNGWGSISFSGNDIIHELSAQQLDGITRQWKECLALDWPHAIGKDEEGPLVWDTTEESGWEKAFHRLGQVRKDINKLDLPALPLLPGRCILSYPVTKKVVPRWGSAERIANQLRFKVICTGGRYHGRIYHIPCRPPDTLIENTNQNRNLLIETWNEVHRYLGTSRSGLTRLGHAAQALPAGGRR